MYFWTFELRKTWLDKWLKSPVWEDPSTCKMVKAPKHCWNLKDSTFTIFIDHCEGNSVGKSFSHWYGKSRSCLLTHWLSMKSILFLIETIYRSIFRCSYPRNKKILPIFFLHFRNLEWILNILKKRMTLIPDIFFNLGTLKNVVREMSKKSSSRGPFDK